MSKKKTAATKKSSTKSSSRQAKAGPRKPPIESQRATKLSASQPPAAHFVYRHEIESNPDNAPLVVDIAIGAGRGEQPARPSFVGFTAEMAEEQWPDQFAFRIISLENTSVRVMISRVDKGSQELGWGIKLVVHVLVIADALA